MRRVFKERNVACRFHEDPVSNGLSGHVRCFKERPHCALSNLTNHDIRPLFAVDVDLGLDVSKIDRARMLKERNGIRQQLMVVGRKG